MQEKQWKIREVDTDQIKHAQEISGLSPSLSRVLASRDISTEQEFEQYINPRLSSLMCPYQLPDMKKAVERIWKAIQENEQIVIFGDYDVDGVTASALLMRIFKDLNVEANVFIPNRLDEGYGFTVEAIERCLKEQSATLVITVDCGSNAVEAVRAVQADGIDIIITDHHEIEHKAADAFAVINPKLGKDDSLWTLAGVGVAFKLAHALLKHGREKNYKQAEEIELRDYLDFVALGTISDVVPLENENRVLVRHGLSQLDQTRWEGLRALKDVVGIKGSVNTYHLGFQLGPRINAAGRIGHPVEALHLLITDDAASARERAAILNQTNIERQQIERDITIDAFRQIDEYFNPDEHYGLVVAGEEWHPGVVGIVASRISRHYNRPAIVMGHDSDGTMRGSCRSISEFNILDGLRECEDYLVKYGGHKMAAGLQLDIAKLENFKKAFNDAVSEQLHAENLIPSLHIDAVIDHDELSWDFINNLNRFRPFGQSNPEPSWALYGVEVIGQVMVLADKHIKFKVRVGESIFSAVQFNAPELKLPAEVLDLVFTLSENRWKGRTSIQLTIKDIRPAIKLDTV